jgi:hypothetical protein
MGYLVGLLYLAYKLLNIKYEMIYFQTKWEDDYIIPFSWKSFTWSRYTPYFMKTKGALPVSKDPGTAPNSEPYECGPKPHISFL